MNTISLEQDGTAKWFERSGLDVSRARDANCTSVLEAIRYVMEQLPPDIRGSAWIETRTGSLGIGDIQVMYARTKFCPRASLESRVGADTSTRGGEGGAPGVGRAGAT